MLNLAARTSLRHSTRLHLANFQNPSAAKRTIITLKDQKVCGCGHIPVVLTHLFISTQYTAHATARGQGRNGEVQSDGDGGLSLRLASPKSMGGKGDGQNPEQLFAMGVSVAS